MKKAERAKLAEQLAERSKGWNQGEAETIFAASRETAEQILDGLPEEMRGPGLNIWPRLNGGVNLQWSTEDALLSLDITSDGKIASVFAHRGLSNADAIEIEAPEAIAFLAKHNPLKQSS